MSMSASAPARRRSPAVGLTWPMARAGAAVVEMLAYCGGLATLTVASAFPFPGRSRDDDAPGYWGTLKDELAWLLWMGTPLIALVHVGMGSFMSMQAYFGSTFVDGTGAVVGVGLIRNVASMVTAMTLSGLIACRVISQLSGRRRPWKPGPGASGGGVDPGRFEASFRHRTTALNPRLETAPRMAACGIATVMLSLWGCVVGTVVGWQAAQTLMGLSTNMYFLMFFRMLWFRDVVGLIAKGMLFGGLTAAICCFEGLRMHPAPDEDDPSDRSPHSNAVIDLSGPIVRATSVSLIAVLVVNMSWFILLYHAIPVYGPSLLQPPTP